jgi:cephalosporin-C deacetylase-like acetyl esterase
MAIVNRREFLLESGVLAASLGMAPRSAFAGKADSYSQGMSDMLLSYLGGKLNALRADWDRKRSMIRTPESLELRNRFVREKFREMLNGFPERTPLNAVVVNSRQREGYRVENVMFQSRPDYWVTGNLYIPSSGEGPFPGIISPCGHYPLARMAPPYQMAYMNLVRSGFVVLAYDPVGQGERRQYWDPQTDFDEIDSLRGDSAIFEHSMPGQLLLLMGENLTQYRVWDGMRALDYLLTRKEVDREKTGCAGHSGGGTLTLFISALDERVRCAVVVEGGTSHRWPVNFSPGDRVGPSDVEQNLFPSALYGIDLCDLHVAIAPRPLLALIEDYGPGFNLAAQHIRERYELLGVPEKFATGEATDPHAWTVKLRLATTDWFCRWFYGRPGPVSEPAFEPEEPRKLFCTPNGSIRYSSQGETIFSIILKKQWKLPPDRNVPATSSELENFRREMRTKIAERIHYHKSAAPLGVRDIVTTPRKGYHIEKLEFISEPDIYIPTWVFVPAGKQGRLSPILYLHEEGKEAEGMEFGVLEKLAQKGNLVIAIDVRGIGSTTPPHSADIEATRFRHLFSVETAMAYMAWYMDESLFGMRVADVIRALDYTESRPDVDQATIRLIGVGRGALWALFAAALDSRVRAVVCDGGLLSYHSLTASDLYLHSADVFVKDVLLHFDLPQVAAAVADRRLILASPVDAMKNPVELPGVRETYRWAAEVYAQAGASNRLRCVRSDPDADPADQYLEFLGG